MVPPHGTWVGNFTGTMPILPQFREENLVRPGRTSADVQLRPNGAHVDIERSEKKPRLHASYIKKKLK
jgi:hypothetical protein